MTTHPEYPLIVISDELPSSVPAGLHVVHTALDLFAAIERQRTRSTIVVLAGSFATDGELAAYLRAEYPKLVVTQLVTNAPGNLDFERNLHASW